VEKKMKLVNFFFTEWL